MRLLCLILTSSLSAVLVAGRLSGTGISPKEEGENSGPKQERLLKFPLIPGDSPEMKRRRRKRQRRRELYKSSQALNAKVEKEGEERNTNEEEEEQNESPLELHRDILYEGYGTHYVDLWVGCGESPQRVTVIVDTGSSFTGFPCVGCHRCGGSDDKNYHTDDYYNPSKSTCFQVVDSQEDCWLGKWQAAKNEDDSSTCRASAHYSEGSSWSAYEAIDTVYTGGDHKHVVIQREEHDSFPLHFGCQDSVTGLFESQLADGIMGMKVGKTSFWSQMYDAGKLEQPAFSLCFSHADHVERKGTQAGAMVLGGADKRLHSTDMVYAKQMANNGKYVVHLEKIFLQDAETGELTNVQAFEEDLNNRGEIIVDSGTTSTYLSRKLNNHFVDAWNEMVPKDVMQMGGGKDTFTLKREQLQSLPTIVFQMKAWTDGDVKKGEDPETTTIPGIVGQDMKNSNKYAGKSILVAMPPSHYLTHDNGDQYFLDLFFSQADRRGGVLGANFMRGHDILFDNHNNRIGFAQSDCEYKMIADEEDEEAN